MERTRLIGYLLLALGVIVVFIAVVMDGITLSFGSALGVLLLVDGVIRLMLADLPHS